VSPLRFWEKKGKTAGGRHNFFNRPDNGFSNLLSEDCLAAGVNAASEAAKNFHDDRIGKGGVIHLFRLPPSLELRLHEHLFKDAATLRQLIENTSTARTLLERYGTGTDRRSSQPADRLLSAT